MLCIHVCSDIMKGHQNESSVQNKRKKEPEARRKKLSLKKKEIEFA